MDEILEGLRVLYNWAWVPALGAIGGLMGALDRAQQGKQVFWSSRTAFGVLASAFMGGLSYGILTHYGISGGFLGSAIGISGYLGPKIIDDFYMAVKNRGSKEQGN